MFLRRSIFTKAILAILLVGNVVPMAAGFSVSGIDFGSIFSKFFKKPEPIKEPVKWYSGLKFLYNTKGKKIGLAAVGALAVIGCIIKFWPKGPNGGPGGNGGGSDRPDHKPKGNDNGDDDEDDKRKKEEPNNPAQNNAEPENAQDENQVNYVLPAGAQVRKALENDGDCSMCTMKMEKDSDIVVLKCGHKYHRDCASGNNIQECLVDGCNGEGLVDDANMENCPTCKSKNKKEDIVQLSCCGAKCCKGCIKSFVDTYKNSKSLDSLNCINPNCKHDQGDMRGKRRRILKSDLRKCGVSEQDIAIFEEIEAREFEDYPGFRHCPTPECKQTYVLEQNEKGEMLAAPRTCEGCHKTYCGKCGFEHDFTIKCEAAQKVAKMTPEQRANHEWMRANTKACPRCKRLIQKNDGCKHMVCGKNCDDLGGHVGCGYHFCWDCLESGPGPDGAYPHNVSFFECPGVPKSNFDEAQEAGVQENPAGNRQGQRVPAQAPRQRNPYQDPFVIGNGIRPEIPELNEFEEYDTVGDIIYQRGHQYNRLTRRPINQPLVQVQNNQHNHEHHHDHHDHQHAHNNNLHFEGEERPHNLWEALEEVFMRNRITTEVDRFFRLDGHLYRHQGYWPNTVRDQVENEQDYEVVHEQRQI